MLIVLSSGTLASLLAAWARGRCWLDARHTERWPEYVAFGSSIAGAAGFTCQFLTWIALFLSPGAWLGGGAGGRGFVVLAWMTSLGLLVSVADLAVVVALNVWAAGYRRRHLGGRGGSLAALYGRAEREYRTHDMVDALRDEARQTIATCRQALSDEGVPSFIATLAGGLLAVVAGLIVAALGPGIMMGDRVMTSAIRAAAAERLKAADLPSSGS